nr:MAG TPA: hypothetical protein [Caudoviricetes sp.]DAO71819.1 MAG TPA: hypothetical protein [Caudoviricetes sp.]
MNILLYIVPKSTPKMSKIICCVHKDINKSSIYLNLFSYTG